MTTKIITIPMNIGTPKTVYYGSRRGAACMVGATAGWFLGCIIFSFTSQPVWLIAVPMFSIIVGAIFGKSLFSEV